MAYETTITSQNLKIDQAQALQHLSMLGCKDGDQVCLRFFYPSDDPRKEKDTGKKLTYKFPNLNWSEIERQQRDGRGCYVVVNHGGHTDKEITSFRAIFYEHDDLSKAEQVELWKSLGYGLPSFQLDTGGKSIHTYYLFNATDFANQPTTEKMWRELQADLIKHSKGDKALKNPSRVMRLSGAYHVSNPSGERRYEMSRIISVSGADYSPHARAISYTYAQLRAMVPSASAQTEAQQVIESPEAYRDHGSSAVSSISGSSDFPLDVALSQEHQTLLETGVTKGSRNCKAYSLACDLIGTARVLQGLGVRIVKDPKMYFDLFCSQKCVPALSTREAQRVWESAMNRNDGKGARSDESIEKSVKWWQSKQRKTQRSTEARLDRPVEKEQRTDPYRVTEDAATPEHHLNRFFFKEGKGDYCVIDNMYYREGDGVWTALDDNQVEQTISEELKKLYQVKSRNKEPIHVYSFATAKNVRSVFSFNQAALAIPDDARPNDRYLINFKNGVLDTRTGRLSNYSRTLYLTTQIQAEYLENQPCPEAFLRFVERCYGLDQLEQIRAIVRYCVDFSLPYGWFIHLMGKSGTGKGTLIRFLSKLHSQHYKALSEFSSLNTAEGRQQTLTGGRLIAFPDLIGALPKLNAFYELVDNGALSGRRLYVSTTTTKRWNVRFLLASVDPMRFENSDAGWKRRVIPISTLDRDGEVAPSIEAALEGIEAEVVSWAMAMPKEDVIKQFTSEKSKSPKYLRLQDEQAIASDSVQAFIDACLIPSSGGQEINKLQIFGFYKAYCEATGKKAKEFNGFCRGISSELKKKFEAARTSKSDNGKTISIPARFINIELIDPHLFILKILPGGLPATEEQAIYTCNATRLSEGGLQRFREWNSVSQAEIALNSHNNEQPPTVETVPVVESAKVVTEPTGQKLKAGDRVVYAGKNENFKAQYSGVLTVDRVDPREGIACKRLDGRLTTWLPFKDLKQVSSVEVAA